MDQGGVDCLYSVTCRVGGGTAQPKAHRHRPRHRTRRVTVGIDGPSSAIGRNGIGRSDGNVADKGSAQRRPEGYGLEEKGVNDPGYTVRRSGAAKRPVCSATPTHGMTRRSIRRGTIHQIKHLRPRSEHFRLEDDPPPTPDTTAISRQCSMAVLGECSRVLHRIGDKGTDCECKYDTVIARRITQRQHFATQCS